MRRFERDKKTRFGGIKTFQWLYEKIDTPGTGSDVKISFLNDSAARANVDMFCHCEVMGRASICTFLT